MTPAARAIRTTFRQSNVCCAMVDDVYRTACRGLCHGAAGSARIDRYSTCASRTSTSTSDRRSCAATGMFLQLRMLESANRSPA